MPSMRIVLALLMMLGSSALLAEEELPILAQVYYSKDDATCPATEKAIDAAMKRFPQLLVEKISIDTDEGYQKLAAAEKANLITKHGDVTLVSGSLTLTDKGERRDIETYLE